ncbi:MAG: leucine-rich repeat domain-containing protein [Lachnospiraceae bacterium]|nr:leucine-rich repeat domain-containing protein [Lachnospiraceae bacterium]MDE7185403.1 leucine-rich repeat domain-containing protein [Lachnospiraceae bacterium]
MEREIIKELIIENTGSGGGQIVIVPYKNGYALKRYRGTGEQIIVPSFIDQKPVTAIERKAFLSCKTIKRITLPDTVEEIGDWAFAHAEQLRTVVIPYRELARGKELFLGCKRLREIVLCGCERCSDGGLGRMLALAVTVLHDYFLFDPVEVGTQEWVRRWDEKLMDLIELDDLDGFEELWTCGEEDYEGKDYDIKSYPVEKRKMKLRVVYFRLLHPYKLSEEMNSRLQEYLCRHTKGTQTPQAWELLVEEHPQDLAYYQVFAAAGGITEENFDGLLEDLKDSSAELRAYLLRYKEEHFASKDAFAAFELDW